MKSINFQKKKVFFTDEGEGNVLVLLHGFTESMSIWDHFRKKLSKRCRVITLDLPGHGKSENLAPVHSMELMADVVMKVLQERKVDQCTMIGHSMGGYITLAFAAKYPEMLKSFGLFHSHPFADNLTQKENRDRTSKIVEKDKFGFVTQFITELFPEDVREKFGKKIKKLISEASVMTKEGVIASLQGMKERVNQTEVLRTTDLPVLFIIGLNDSKFPQKRLKEMITLPKQAHTLILRDAGHMGYIEEEKATLRAVRGFLGC